uniref:P-type domain-containing protein n=1 Tax=Cuerna arida TaxID=1464854 RepID=A0A1B6F1T2_9HEMI
MTEIRYKTFKKPKSKSEKFSDFVFKNPSVYFSILIFVLLLVLFFSPHVVILKVTDNSDVEIDYERELSDFEVYVPFDHEPVKKDLGLPVILVQTAPTNAYTSAQCTGFIDSEKFDCLPQQSVSEEECTLRGCCWVPLNSSEKAYRGVPYCYYPSSFKTYKYLNVSVTDLGATAYLQILTNSTYPNNIQLVKIDFNYLTENVLQVKIYDAENARFESPFPKMSSSNGSAVKNVLYVVDIDKDKLGFNVIRKSNNQSIFNTKDVGGFLFSDQLLQLSARLPSSQLYGLGQQRNDFQLDMGWRQITLFNRDQAPIDKSNLYGSHPFYLAMERDGLSNGVLLHNSNAMDIILQPAPAITYRAIGGILDFYFFLGPSPSDVVRQYTGLVGLPFMPPYWSLGFHLCRFGYNTLNNTKEVLNRTRAAGIPLDTQWNDLDYMQHHNDFTYDKVAFKGLPEFVDSLHQQGLHYVVLLDPGVSGGETPGTYPPYDEGLREGIFVKDPKEDKPFVTKVWNDKSTVFPDFFHPKTGSYWQKQIRQLHETFAFDGLWIDMNDPSTFFDGGQYGCAPNPLDNPPYLPGVNGGKLYSRTLCMSARHYNVSHYNIHNIFASQEAVLTTKALLEVRKNQRPFVISRSSYPGHGHFTGVWTGDVFSTWDDMAHSISDILSFSLFGIPMSGADICGFNGNTTIALCQRWSQLGAFYPFSRNHNTDNAIDQDPVALGPGVVDAARKALLVRYSLLPFLYTLFWHAHTKGDTVARPLFFESPKDEKTYGLHSQFLWGSALLIAPILSEEKTYATAYLPAGRWYDFYTYRPINSKGSTYLLPKQMDMIPLLLSGGNIVPTQQPNTTTTASRKNPMGLLVALCSAANATGDLYWDDGDSLDHEDGVYNYVTFAVTKGQLSSSVQQWKYTTTLKLAEVKVMGVEETVTNVTIDGSPAHFSYKADVKLLNVTSLSVDLSKPFILSWS